MRSMIDSDNKIIKGESILERVRGAFADVDRVDREKMRADREMERVGWAERSNG